MYVARSHDWLPFLHWHLREPSNHTLARWAKLLCMENSENYWPSDLLTLGVLCTLNTVGSCVCFLESMCLHEQPKPRTECFWELKYNVIAWNRADTRRVGNGLTWESLKHLRISSIKGRITPWGLFLHYWMPETEKKNHLNDKKLFTRSGYKMTVIYKTLLFLWTHCYVPELLNNKVLI